MAGILSSSEIDALMDAIKAGEVPTQTEGEAAAGYTPYDLTSQDRIIRGQMPTLDSINDLVVSRLASGLQGRLRTPVRGATQPSTLMKFMDFNALLTPPANVAVLSLGGAHGLAVLVVDPNLTRVLLTGALGDKKLRQEAGGSTTRRELTTVEKNVLKRLLCLLTEAMQDAWAPLLTLRPEILRFESDPRLAAIASPNDVAILSTYELEIGSGGVGVLQLGLPYAAVESVKKQLSSPPRLASGADDRFIHSLAAEMYQVHVDVVAELGRAHLSMQQLSKLSVDDVLILDAPEGTPVRVYVQGRAKMSGQPMVQRGRLALRLQSMSAPENAPNRSLTPASSAETNA